MRDKLSVEIEGDSLVMRIPIHTLAFAAEQMEVAEGEAPIKIADQRGFARSVVRALSDEGEDGSTTVTRLFDAAFEWVLEQGEDGPDYGDEEPMEADPS